MNASIVNEDVVHLEVSVFTRFLLFELDESVLKGITGYFVSNDLACLDASKTTEYNLKIVIGCDGIELADEKNVFWWCHVSIWDVTNDFEDCSSRFGFTFLKHFLNFCFSLSLGVVNVFVGSDSTIAKSLGGRRRATTRLFEASRILVRILNHHRMSDSDVFEGSTFVIHNRLVQIPQNFMSLHDLADDTVNTIQRNKVGAQGEKELRSNKVVTC